MKNVKLWDLHVGANDPWWKRLIQSAKNIEKLYLYNIPINDDDIENILNLNPFTKVIYEGVLSTRPLEDGKFQFV